MSTPDSSSAVPRPAPGRPKDPAKRAAILQAAQQLFLGHGFEGVSMDQVAARAGVSKLTVYSHFGDKSALFAAAVADYCERQVPPELFSRAPGTPLRPRLLGIARALHALMVSPEAIAAFRLMCTHAPLEPALSNMFWHAGAGRLQAELAEMLSRRRDAGELDIDDPACAAAQFFALLRGEQHSRLILGCDDIAGYDVEAHLEATVDFFLRASLPGDGGPASRPSR